MIDIKTELHFWELGKKLIIKLNDNFWNILDGILFENKLSLKRLDEYLDYYRRARAIPLLHLVTVLNKLGNLKGSLTLKNIEKEHVLAIKTGKTGKWISNPKFPINLLTSEFSELVGLILSEGNINHKKIVTIYNNNEELLGQALKDFEFCFGELKNKAIMSKKDGYGNRRLYTRLPSITGDVLVNNLGCCLGNKVINKVRIPELYLELSKYPKYHSIINGLLRGLFSGDGCISSDLKRWNRRIFLSANGTLPNGEISEIIKEPRKFRKYSPRILNEVRVMMQNMGYLVLGPDFNGKSTLRRHVYEGKEITSCNWRIRIANMQDIERFKNEVNLICTDQKQKLENMVNSYRRRCFKHGFWKTESLNALKELQYNNIPLTSKTLSDKLGISNVTAVKYMRSLKNQHIVDIVYKKPREFSIYSLL